jgi:hypothetical protein
MGKVHPGIDGSLASWLREQPVFFVATAPLSAAGHINVSPRGGAGMFAVLDEHTVAWLDLIGSGAETIAHLRENGRITVMFCAFDGRPNVVRLHGRGRFVLPGADGWDDLASRFPGKRSARAVVVVDVQRVSDSCGFGVPLLRHVEDRDLLDQWADRRSDQQIAAYLLKNNTTSLDGLPAVPVADALSGQPSETPVSDGGTRMRAG